MMKILQGYQRVILGISCMLLLSCAGNTVEQEKTGSGVMIDISAMMKGFVDAGSIVSASVRSLWSDAQNRVTDIAEGTEKIREGKEQVERGVRGN